MPPLPSPIFSILTKFCTSEHKWNQTSFNAFSQTTPRISNTCCGCCALGRRKPWRGWLLERDKKSGLTKGDTLSLHVLGACIFSVSLKESRAAKSRPKRRNAFLSGTFHSAPVRTWRFLPASFGAPYQSLNKNLCMTFPPSLRKCLYQKSLFIIPRTSDYAIWCSWTYSYTSLSWWNPWHFPEAFFAFLPNVNWYLFL